MCTAHQILFADKIMKNKMRGACSKYGERKVANRVLVVSPDG